MVGASFLILGMKLLLLEVEMREPIINNVVVLSHPLQDNIKLIGFLSITYFTILKRAREEGERERNFEVFFIE